MWLVREQRHSRVSEASILFTTVWCGDRCNSIIFNSATLWLKNNNKKRREGSKDLNFRTRFETVRIWRSLRTPVAHEKSIFAHTVWKNYIFVSECEACVFISSHGSVILSDVPHSSACDTFSCTYGALILFFALHDN